MYFFNQEKCYLLLSRVSFFSTVIIKIKEVYGDFQKSIAYQNAIKNDFRKVESLGMNIETLNLSKPQLELSKVTFAKKAYVYYRHASRIIDKAPINVNFINEKIQIRYNMALMLCMSDNFLESQLYVVGFLKIVEGLCKTNIHLYNQLLEATKQKAKSLLYKIKRKIAVKEDEDE